MKTKTIFIVFLAMIIQIEAANYCPKNLDNEYYSCEIGSDITLREGSVSGPWVCGHEQCLAAELSKAICKGDLQLTRELINIKASLDTSYPTIWHSSGDFPTISSPRDTVFGVANLDGPNCFSPKIILYLIKKGVLSLEEVENQLTEIQNNYQNWIHFNHQPELLQELVDTIKALKKEKTEL